MPESNETDFWLTPHHFISSQIRLTALSLREMQVSFLFGASARTCRENLYFDRQKIEMDWSIQVT